MGAPAGHSAYFRWRLCLASSRGGLGDRMRSLLVIFIFVRVTFIPAALLIVVWFLIQLLNAGAVAHVQTGGVAYLAHIGGCIFGAVTARWFEDPQRIAEQGWGD
jgi:membrane associated rhomboid family serine protease